MKKFIGVIGGVLIIISVFLPSITVGPISLSLWSGAPTKGVAILFIVFGLIIATGTYFGKKWSKIIAVIVAILALGLDIKYISDAASLGIEFAGIGLWICLIGAIMGIVGPFLKSDK